MSELKKLLPCPFCGASAYHANEPTGKKFIYFVVCTQCGIQGISRSTTDGAADEWNKRLAPVSIPVPNDTRDWFAGKALQGVLAVREDSQVIDPDFFAEQAYELADAMLRTRKS